jgi:hypothetical protein
MGCARQGRKDPLLSSPLPSLSTAEKREGTRVRGAVVRPPDGGGRDEQTNGGGADSGGGRKRSGYASAGSVLLFSPRFVSAAALDGRRPGNHLRVP